VLRTTFIGGWRIVSAAVNNLFVTKGITIGKIIVKRILSWILM